MKFLVLFAAASLGLLQYTGAAPKKAPAAESKPKPPLAETKALLEEMESLRAAGKYQEALPLAEHILKSCEASYGPDHNETAGALLDVASLKSSLGKADQASP